MQRKLTNLNEVAEYDTQVPTIVKWAGGKQSLLSTYQEYLPGKINTYIEPFLGGAAMLLFMAKNNLANNYIANDINSALITTYNVIQSNPKALMTQLKKLRENHSELQYYKVRGLQSRKTKSLNIDEEGLWNLDKLTDVQVAARFIYLNKTCFNGLYRENSDGQFNVPMGRYKNPSIFNKQIITKAAKLFSKVQLHNKDYKEIAEKAKKGDLVYFDPPYAPLNPSSDFTKYSKDDFNLQDQKELATLFQHLNQKGVSVMLSNSSADIMLDLYKEYNIHMIDAKRSINSKGNKRDEIKEILVTNY